MLLLATLAATLEVKLKLVWSNLIAPLIPRLRTGDVDIDLSPNPHLSEEAKKEHHDEVQRRQALQNRFFKQWLLDTRGPRQNYYWKFDNREAYRTELANLLNQELAEYRMQFDKLYESLMDEDFGPELAEKEVEEVHLGFIDSFRTLHQERLAVDFAIFVVAVVDAVALMRCLFVLLCFFLQLNCTLAIFLEQKWSTSACNRYIKHLYRVTRREHAEVEAGNNAAR